MLGTNIYIYIVTYQYNNAPSYKYINVTMHQCTKVLNISMHWCTNDLIHQCTSAPMHWCIKTLIKLCNSPSMHQYINAIMQESLNTQMHQPIHQYKPGYYDICKISSWYYTVCFMCLLHLQRLKLYIVTNILNN